MQSTTAPTQGALPCGANRPRPDAVGAAAEMLGAERAMLMGGACAKAYGWLLKKD